MKKPKLPCTIGDCTSPILARGWCNKHYLRWKNHGDPLGEAPPPKRIPTVVRFMSKVAVSPNPDACWEWFGAQDRDGYGIFWDGTYQENGHPRYVRCPRWSFAQYVGPIPDGQHVLHQCDNPPCVNPSHLFTGTESDNHADREAKGRGVRMHGSTHVKSKLTEVEVLEMRTRRAGGEPQVSLAQRFGVSSAQVSYIVRRKVWTHI